MEFRVLGPLEVRRADEAIDLGPYRRRSLLALLLTEPNVVWSTDRIIDALWGDHDGDRQKALWVHVSGLRTALEPDRRKRTDGTILLTRPPGYVLRAPPESIDAVRFERRCEAARAILESDPAEAAARLRDALASWRGAPFADFEYEEFAQPEIARLEELRLAAVEARIDADLRCGRARELTHELESLVRLHPLREELTAQWMTALYRSGRQADALRAFRLLRTRLAEELGLDPSQPLLRLEQRILVGDPTLEHPTDTPRPSVTVSGVTVRGYELQEQIGTGSAGITYRAHQPAVGRDVAITVIGPDLANDPGFIRRFEAEAQLVARLEHPHVMPLYDYWREPGGAYLVTRWGRGGELGGLMAEGALPTERVVRLADQVASALQAAHDAGVIHGDVRPGSIVLDDDDNAYLTNFGIARSAPPGGSTAADVFGFGVVLAQALAGRPAPLEDLRPSLPPKIREVIEQATHADADQRPRPMDVVRALRAAVGVSGPAEGARDELPNPYKGLRAFEAADADHFAGRERIVADLLHRMGEPGPTGRFIALVGPSGSGKSSVIRAGVLPALRRGEVAGSERWFTTTMTPGAHPFDALEDALRRVVVDPPVDLLERLTSEGILTSVGPLIPDGDAELVILVDQFEELFSHASPAEASSFMDAVAATVATEGARVRFIITLRADFYDCPLRHRSFGRLLESGTLLITPMSEEELQRAITAPAAAVGVTFEPGLTARIEADMADQSTALPLLQYALTELFDQRSGSTMTIEAYRRLGGVSGTLGRRAEHLYESLQPPDQELTRDIFLRLVTLNEDGPDTRRRARIDEISDAAHADATLVLETFGRARLLSFDRDPVSRSPTVEAAHEALLVEWQRLRSWITDSRDNIVLQRSLSVASTQWTDHGRDADFLLRGSQLAPYESWIDDPPVRLTAAERGYLLTCTEQAEREAMAERRRIGRLRRLLAGVAAALVLALIAGGVAVRQRERAEQQTDVAVRAAEAAAVSTLISRARAIEAEDPDLGLLLALEARRRAPGRDTDRAVLSALGAATIASRIAVRPALQSDCGSTSPGFGREVSTIEGRMVAQDVLDGNLVDLGPAPAPCATGDRNDRMGFAQTPDGRRLWLGPDLDTELDFDQPTVLREMTPRRALLVRSETESDAVLVVDARTGRQVGPTVPVDFAHASATSADGSLFAVTTSAEATWREGPGEGATLVIDAASGAVVSRRDEPVVSDPFFDEAAGQLFVAAHDGMLGVVDPRTGESIRSIDTGLDNAPIELWRRDDGTLLGAYPDRIRYLDPTTGETRNGPEVDELVDAALTSDRYLTAWSRRGGVAVYDLASNAAIGATYDVGSGHQAVNDGRAAVVNREVEPPEATVVDLSSGNSSPPPLLSADGDTFEPVALFPAPDGLWAVSADHVLAHWQDGELVDTLDLGSVDGVVGDLWQGSGTMFGDYYAVHGRRPDRTEEAVLVRVRPGPPEVMFTVDTEVPTGLLQPTPDGGVHRIGDDGTITSYDPAGKLVATIPTEATRPDTVALDQTGARLAVGSTATGRISIVDLATGTTETVPGVSEAATLGFNSDGSAVTMSLRDGTLRLYDVGGGVPVTVFTGTPLVWAAEPGWYDPESESIWMPIGNQVVEVLLDPDVWAERACAVVGRDLTRTEWDLYVPGELPRQPVCGDGT